jgi:hypothetical protein
LQLRNTRNTKKQSNLTPPKVYNSSITDSKDVVIDEMLEKDFQ